MNNSSLANDRASCTSPTPVRNLVENGERVAAYVAPDPAEAEGVNTRAELAEAAAALRDRINEAHMLAGVTIVDPKSTWIEADVEIEADATIHPFTVLNGKTKVGAGAVVGPHVAAVDAVIGPEATVGPFCYLRPGTVLEARAKAGTFVEIKNSHIGEGAKVPHLSYIGDAEVGEGTNIGAGGDHSQLSARARPGEVPDGNRPQRAHGQRQCVRCSGHDWRQCLGCRGLGRHEERPARGPRDRPKQDRSRKRDMTIEKDHD